LLRNLSRPVTVIAGAERPSGKLAGNNLVTMTHKFDIEIRISAPGKRGRMRTLVEAHRFITNEIPAELAKLPRWTFALDLIDHAARTGKRRDIEAAGRQIKQALSNEHWLALESTEAG
jgi:hypothetical protein